MKKLIMLFALPLLLSACGNTDIYTIGPEHSNYIEYFPLVPAEVTVKTERTLARTPLWVSKSDEDTFSKKVCISTEEKKEAMVPSKIPRYIRVEMPWAGRGGGQILLNNKGGLQSVSANSDTTAIPKAAIGAAASIAPWAALVKGIEALTSKLDVLDIPGNAVGSVDEILRSVGGGFQLFNVPPNVSKADKDSAAVKQLSEDLSLSFQELQDKYCAVEKVNKTYNRFEPPTK